MNEKEKFPVYSISISGKVSWQLHALNNEGNEGNQTLTRRYYIVEPNDSGLKYVNGLSEICLNTFKQNIYIVLL